LDYPLLPIHHNQNRDAKKDFNSPSVPLSTSLAIVIEVIEH